MIVIQVTVLVAVHAQLDPVTTAMLPLLPVAGADIVVADTLYVQLFAAWVTVRVRPATVNVPDRGTPVELAATVKVADPRPDMEARLVMVIHATALVAVHAQLEPVMTETVPLKPVEGADTLAGDTEYVHCASALRASRTRASAMSGQQRRSVMNGLVAIPDRLHIPRRTPTPQPAVLPEVTRRMRCCRFRICQLPNEIAIA